MKTFRYSIPLIILILSVSTVCGRGIMWQAEEGNSQPDSVKEVSIPIAQRSVPFGELTGAVSVIQRHDLQNNLDANILGVLKGKAAGLYIREAPGAHREGQFTLNIRGQQNGGIATSVPLLIVDGIERPFEFLQVEDIETISVLKDAVAKGFYKGREASGVILVTTRRGKQHVYENQVTVETGVSAPMKLPVYLPSSEYATLYNLARHNSGLSDLYTTADINAYKSKSAQYPTNDYYGTLLKDSRSFTRASAVFSGGEDKLRYFVSGSYLRNGGLEAVGKPNAMNQFSARSNIDYQINNIFQAFLDVYGFVDMNTTNYLQAGELFTRMSTQRPNEYPFLLREHVDADSVLYGASRFSTSASYQNLYAEMKLGGFRENTQRVGQTNLGTNLNFSEYIDGLTGKVMFSFDTYNSVATGKNDDFYSYIPMWQQNQLVGETLATVGKKNANMSRFSTDGYRRFALTGQLNYSHVWNDNRLDAGFVFFGERSATMLDNFQHSFQSNTVRLSYAYKKTWVAEFNGGFVGSSRLPKKSHYGFFPAGGLTWLVSEEDFFQAGDWFDLLKFRASYGVTGTDDALRQFSYQTRWNYLESSSYYTYFGVDAATLARIATIQTQGNESLKWEKSKELNIGTDVLVFGRASLTADYYRTERSDVPILQGDVFSQINGVSERQLNYLDIRTNGIDATFTYKGGNDQFRYQLGLNLNYSKSVYNVAPTWSGLPESRSKTGKPVDAHIGMQSAGLFRNASELSDTDQRFGETAIGDIRYKDTNGDGKIDEGDMSAIGNSFPRTQYGIQLMVSYKNFALSVGGYGAGGFDIYLNNSFYRPMPESAYSVIARDAYNPETGTGSYPRLTMTNSTNNYRLSDFWLRSGDFFRVKEAELRYGFPKRVAETLRLGKFELFARGNNLFTISGLKDVDPEFINAGITGYPFMRTFTGGVTLIF